MSKRLQATQKPIYRKMNKGPKDDCTSVSSQWNRDHSPDITLDSYHTITEQIQGLAVYQYDAILIKLNTKYTFHRIHTYML